MRLLLTSSGITNKSISDALLGLVGRPCAECRLVFVPTAANAEDGDKGWVSDDLDKFRAVGFAHVDVVDIAALEVDESLKRLEVADVLVFGGGNTPYLLDTLRTSGLAAALPNLLESRVYVGISAGSIVAGRQAVEELSTDLYNEDTAPCLGLVDVVFLPHLNAAEFPKAREDNIRAKSGGIASVFALDDQSALKIIDGSVQVISEGTFLQL